MLQQIQALAMHQQMECLPNNKSTSQTRTEGNSETVNSQLGYDEDNDDEKTSSLLLMLVHVWHPRSASFAAEGGPSLIIRSKAKVTMKGKMERHRPSQLVDAPRGLSIILPEIHSHSRLARSV